MLCCLSRRKRERIGPDKRLAETVFRKRKVEIAEGKFLAKRKVPRCSFNELALLYLAWAKVNHRDYAPRAASPRAAPAVQAARPQPPVLSVRCGASRRPAGGIQRWPAAGAGRAGRTQARASAGRVAAGWHGVGGRSRWQRPFDFPIPSGVWRCNFSPCSAQCHTYNRKNSP